MAEKDSRGWPQIVGTSWFVVVVVVDLTANIGLICTQTLIIVYSVNSSNNNQNVPLKDF